MNRSSRAGLATADLSVLTDERVVVIRRYAEALVNAAADQAEAALGDLEALEEEVLRPFPQLGLLLASSQVPVAEKERVIVQICEGRISDIVLRFLRVLVRRGRIDLLIPITREARRLWDRRHRRIPVQVRSAVALDDAQQQAVRDQVARMISATPILQIVVDPALIGGLVVQVGDQVYDASVRHRLEQLRQRLIEGKTYEIQSRRDQLTDPA
jgi:F-type H+-transporting ATPase subunit delta